MRRELCAVALVLALACCLCAFARAEETRMPPFGVIERHTPPLAQKATLAQLDVAYVRQDKLIPKAGDTVSWTVYATGGDGVYSYEYILNSVKDVGGSYYTSYADGLPLTRDNTASFTIESAGMYCLLVYIHDEAGESIGYQTLPFTVYRTLNAADESTVFGQVKKLAKQCREASFGDEYAMALWLHDYLIYHANYDFTFTYYYPEGVLLHEAGVCQSYALAYEMLLREVGIESILLTGLGNGENHAWNMVRIDGKWYQVDCTWDDPGMGGQENHSYFCVTDTVMAKDHEWAEDWKYLPRCADDSLVPDETFGAAGYADKQELRQIILNAIGQKQEELLLYDCDGNLLSYLDEILYSTEVSQKTHGWSWMGSGDLIVIRFGYLSRVEVQTLQEAYDRVDSAAQSRKSRLTLFFSMLECKETKEGIKQKLDAHLADIPAVTYFSTDTTRENDFYVRAEINLGYDGMTSAMQPASLDFTRKLMICDIGQSKRLRVRCPAYAYDPAIDGFVSVQVSDFAYTWKSSDESVATVDENGVVTVLGSGACTVTASCGAATASCKVMVWGLTVVLPEDTLVVEADAFRGDAAISAVRCNAALREIQSGAFADCPKLTTVIIESDDVVIAEDAFDGCGEILFLNADGTVRR